MSTMLVAGALIACIASAVLARSVPAVIAALVFSAAALAGSLVTQAPSSVPWVLVAALLPVRALLGGDGPLEAGAGSVDSAVTPGRETRAGRASRVRGRRD